MLTSEMAFFLFATSNYSPPKSGKVEEHLHAHNLQAESDKSVDNARSSSLNCFADSMQFLQLA